MVMVVMAMVTMSAVPAGVAVVPATARQQRIVSRRYIVRLIHSTAGANNRERRE
jgi:hypothetical protein